MLKRYLVTNHTALDRILAWVADPDHRCQLIGSRVADVMQYHMVLDLSYGHLNLIDLITAEFADCVQESEFPRSHS